MVILDNEILADVYLYKDAAFDDNFYGVGLIAFAMDIKYSPSLLFSTARVTGLQFVPNASHQLIFHDAPERSNNFGIPVYLVHFNFPLFNDLFLFSIVSAEKTVF